MLLYRFCIDYRYRHLIARLITDGWIIHYYVSFPFLCDDLRKSLTGEANLCGWLEGARRSTFSRHAGNVEAVWVKAFIKPRIVLHRSESAHTIIVHLSPTLVWNDAYVPARSPDTNLTIVPSRMKSLESARNSTTRYAQRRSNSVTR